MSFSSTVQILKLNEPDKGKSLKTGKDWERRTAECMLLDDSGVVECVGRLVIPPALYESAAVGIYRAAFALTVPTFGDQKGDITARLTGLVPVTAARPAPAPAKL